MKTQAKTHLMNHDDYSSTLLTLLEDQGTYHPVDRDTTAALESERYINGVLLNLRREGCILGKTYYHLHSSAGQVPHHFVLPKIHRQGVPLQPIISIISSLTYELSQAPSILTVTDCCSLRPPCEELQTVCPVCHHPQSEGHRSPSVV